MPASAYDPIASALKNSFNGGAKKSLDSKIESNLQKSMLMTVHFDDPVKQVTISNNSFILNDFRDEFVTKVELSGALSIHESEV